MFIKGNVKISEIKKNKEISISSKPFANICYSKNVQYTGKVFIILINKILIRMFIEKTQYEIRVHQAVFKNLIETRLKEGYA